MEDATYWELSIQKNRREHVLTRSRFNNIVTKPNVKGGGGKAKYLMC